MTINFKFSITFDLTDSEDTYEIVVEWASDILYAGLMHATELGNTRGISIRNTDILNKENCVILSGTLNYPLSLVKEILDELQYRIYRNWPDYSTFIRDNHCNLEYEIDCDNDILNECIHDVVEHIKFDTIGKDVVEIVHCLACDSNFYKKLQEI